jgi:hypothetical protein
MWVQGADDNIGYRVECLGFEDGSRSLKAERPLIHLSSVLRPLRNSEGSLGTVSTRAIRPPQGGR